MKTIRVFPRRTRATPTDDLAYVGEPDLFAEADRVQISVTFTWDWPAAKNLAKAWERVAPVKIGGPATAAVAGDFEPGRFLKPGYVITSRGCPNRCWFCRAWRHNRISGLEELPIKNGSIVQDDNLLACSENHVRNVFAMLARQPGRASFAGGLEAARLADWHVDLLADLRPRPEVFFAYDQPGEWEPLVNAVRRMLAAGFTAASHRLRCYVLIGYPGDDHHAAEHRLASVRDLGLTPAAMLYRDSSGRRPSQEWKEQQRRWMRPVIIYAQRPTAP